MGLFILAWWVFTLVTSIPPEFMPTPVDALFGIKELATERSLASHIAASLARVFAGFGLALSVGVPLGLFLGLHPRVGKAIDPLIQLLRPVSPIAWIPLAILWFGIGSIPAVFIIFLTTVFPIIVSSAAAVLQTNPLLVRMASNFETSKRDMLLKVIFPSSFPQIIVSARISLGIAWVIIVAAEMVGMQSGLGFLVLDSRNFLRTDLVVSTMVVIGAIGFVLDRSVKLVEKSVRRRWGLEEISEGRATS
ncbi:MAG: ABC transporter permease [Thermoplasmatota archaeon]|nr:ABC transporter permease [Candidatus Thermoplasmatota archaeon]MBU1914628.1 ABC transporter permease [Candidatus Thermoplasmatota archaeon]